MSEGKETKIKLFGKTIGLPETPEADGICEPAGQSCDADTENSGNQTPASSMPQSADFDEDSEDQDSQERQRGLGQDNPNDENQAHPSLSNESNATNAPTPLADESKEDPSEPTNSNEKTLKKPDKILPCPRCNSSNTKFCYFNNYNVNQPRHFCKNCQRYWTAGGAMRNVPVGAGRRKNKNLPASQFCPVAGPEAARGNPNGTSFLAFGSDTHVSLCESIVSSLNNGDKMIGRKENNRHECWSEPRKDEVPIFHGVPWPYPQHSIQWSPQMLPPSFGQTEFPVQFYSTAPPYWARPGLWNIPYVIQPTPAPSCGPNSQTLGKHSRDESITTDSEIDQEKQKKSDPDKCLWVPKTLRIDDLGEATRSSIWSTLGINKDRDDDCPEVGINGGGGGLFKALQKKSKDDGERNQAHEKSSTVLQANPAALSRFVSFHESS